MRSIEQQVQATRHADRLPACRGGRTIAGPQGPETDSDADGLSDEEDLRVGTSPTIRDTDEDGVSDNVESSGELV